MSVIPRNLMWPLAAVVFVAIAGCSGSSSSPNSNPDNGGGQGISPLVSPATDYVLTKDIRFQMDDGTVLMGDQYVPANGCPCTTVATFTPYGKETPIANLTHLYYPEHGLALVVVDVRGTGASEGLWQIFSPREQQDYGEVVRQIASLPFANGRIVMAGESYGAIAGLLTAELPATQGLVKAVYGRVPMADAYRDILSSGGLPDFEFLSIWSLGLVQGQSLYEPLQSLQADPPVELNATSQHLVNLLTYDTPANLALLLGDDALLLPNGLAPVSVYDGPFYSVRSPVTNLGNIKVPVMILGGEYDIFARTEPLLYGALPLPVTQKKLIMSPGYHETVQKFLSQDGVPGVYDTQGTLIPSENELATAWFKRWADGVQNNIENFPTLEIYYQGTQRFVPETASPASGTSYARWYFNGTPANSGGGLIADDSLTLDAAAAKDVSVSMLWDPFTGICSRNPIQYLFGEVPDTICSTNSSINDKTAATFTSQPFTAPYTLAGPMNLTAWIMSSRPDTNVVAIVSDVAADGSAVQLSYGSLTASLRALNTSACPTARVVDCSVYGGDSIIVPWHPFTADSVSKLASGQPYELQVEIYPTYATLQPGHRLRVGLQTGDFPHSLPTTSLLVDAAGGITTFLSDAGHRSSLYVGTRTLPE